MLQKARENRAQSETLVEEKEDKVDALSEERAAEIAKAAVEATETGTTTAAEMETKNEIEMEAEFPLPGSKAKGEEEKEQDKVAAMPPKQQDGHGQWEQRLQAGSSRVYYFNKVTGESRWERPRDFMLRRRQSMPPLAHPLERQKTLDDALKALKAPQPSPLASWGGDLVSPKPSWLLSSPKAKSWLLDGDRESAKNEEKEAEEEDAAEEKEEEVEVMNAESKERRDEGAEETIAVRDKETEREREEGEEQKPLPPALIDPAEISVNKIASPKYMRRKPRAVTMLSPITDVSGVSPSSHSSSYYAGQSPTNRLSTPKVRFTSFLSISLSLYLSISLSLYLSISLSLYLSISLSLSISFALVI